MEREVIENRFLFKRVTVEVPHRLEAGKTFAYFGTVVEVGEDYIILDNNGKKTLVHFEQIREIRENF